MTADFNLTSGKNRSLVCYCDCQDTVANIRLFHNTVKGVVETQNIDVDAHSDTVGLNFVDSQSALNIALKYENVAKRLKVGGTFTNVCVGVFFYDQPVPPPEPEPDPDEPTELEDEEDEPVPPSSITSLVCDALRDTFGGVYGASAFVIPNSATEFTLEVEWWRNLTSIL